MTRFVVRSRWLCYVLLSLLVPFGTIACHAERVGDLPLPSSYVNDFAGVLSAGTKQSLEDLCQQLHQKADADVAVVTIKTLEDGQPIEDFTARLEEKWKLGKKGEDRSAIYLIVVKSGKMRIEVGYGLEGILNDAKVGRILDTAVPAAKSGNWDQAATAGTDGMAQVIASDAHVTLSTPPHQYHWQGQGSSRANNRGRGGLGIGQIVVGVIFAGILVVLVLTGNLGWAWILLMSVMGGGGGGGGNDDEGGGGFGGMGGGASGGGGASRDF